MCYCVTNNITVAEICWASLLSITSRGVRSLVLRLASRSIRWECELSRVGMYWPNKHIINFLNHNNTCEPYEIISILVSHPRTVKSDVHEWEKDGGNERKVGLLTYFKVVSAIHKDLWTNLNCWEIDLFRSCVSSNNI